MSQQRKKIVLVANTSWYLYNFRLALAAYLGESGMVVTLLAPEDGFSRKMTNSGYQWRPLPIDRKGMNPLRDLGTIFALYREYRAQRPDIVHHHTVKCALYGTLAARLAGVPAVVNSVTGLGHLFLAQSFRVRAVRAVVLVVYRWLAHGPGVHFLFQNPDDLALFREFGIVCPGKFTLVRGSGVDVERFRPVPAGEKGARPPRVLFAARLLREKGIYELREACLLLRSRGVRFEMHIAGDTDPGNPSAVPKEEAQSWEKEGWMRWLGHVDEIASETRAADIAVLPSWREGLPRSLIEAAAAGLAIVTTNVPGCREVVAHEDTGLLVPARDPAALGAALERLILDSALRARLGARARARALAEFSQESILAKTKEIYNGLLGGGAGQIAAGRSLGPDHEAAR